MIIELAIGAGLLMAGAAVARAMLKRRHEAMAPAPLAKPSPSGPRGLRVRDVLLYTDAELWLAGMIELDEEGFVMRLFAAPAGGRASWVAQLDTEANDIALLDTTKDVPDGLVPQSLPIGGYRLSLHKRGTASIRHEGEHLPRLANRARYTWLEGPGGRIAIVVDFDKGERLALAGERLGREMFDLLPGGDTKND